MGKKIFEFLGSP